MTASLLGHLGSREQKRPGPCLGVRAGPSKGPPDRTLPAGELARLQGAKARSQAARPPPGPLPQSPLPGAARRSWTVGRRWGVGSHTGGRRRQGALGARAGPAGAGAHRGARVGRGPAPRSPEFQPRGWPCGSPVFSPGAHGGEAGSLRGPPGRAPRCRGTRGPGRQAGRSQVPAVPAEGPAAAPGPGGKASRALRARTGRAARPRARGVRTQAPQAASGREGAQPRA